MFSSSFPLISGWLLSFVFFSRLSSSPDQRTRVRDMTLRKEEGGQFISISMQTEFFFLLDSVAWSSSSSPSSLSPSWSPWLYNIVSHCFNEGIGFLCSLITLLFWDTKWLSRGRKEHLKNRKNRWMRRMSVHLVYSLLVTQEEVKWVWEKKSRDTNR